VGVRAMRVQRRATDGALAFGPWYIGMGGATSGVAMSGGTSPCWDAALGGCARRVRVLLGDRVCGRLGVTPIWIAREVGRHSANVVCVAVASRLALGRIAIVGRGGVILFPCAEYLPS